MTTWGLDYVRSQYSCSDHPLLARCREVGNDMSVELEFSDDGSWLVTAKMPDGAVLDAAPNLDETLESGMDDVLRQVEQYLSR